MSKLSLVRASLAVSLLAIASSVAAQESPSGKAARTAADLAEETQEETDIVVTGTLVRGIKPAGSEVISVSRNDIIATGATTTDDVLETIPQLGMFNTLNAIGIRTDSGQTAGGELNVNRYFQSNVPTLRGLPTLILIDGRRMSSPGGSDVVPPPVLERVEIVPDGGSSIYGADAVGGVINFITINRLDGVLANASVGLGDAYHRYNANVAIGRTWDTGSIFLAGNYDWRSDLYGIDRDYIQSLTWSTGLPFSRNCRVGTASVGGVTYAANISGPTPTLGGAGTANLCDSTDNQTIAPQEHRINLLLGMTQQVGDNVELGLRTYFFDRDSNANAGPFGQATGDVNIGPGNPYYIPRFAGDTATQRVQFNYESVNGNRAATRATRVRQWGVSPTVKIDLGEWRFNGMANFDYNDTVFKNPLNSPSAQNSAAARTTLATALNPYNPAATSPSVLAAIFNWQEYGQTKNALMNFRGVFDGPLLSLPGGTVRAAAGAEYIRETFDARNGSTVTNGEHTLNWRHYERDVKAIFAELQIPIFGADNAVSLIRSLQLSASVRHDRYSDFGNTTNPQIGLSYEPLEWLRLRGTWGKSFVAPSTTQQAGTGPATLAIQALPYTKQGDPPQPGQVSIVAAGGKQGLQPQRATIWTLGAEIAPPSVPDVRASVSYYNVKFTGLLGAAPIFSPQTFYRDFVDYYVLHPTAADIQAYANLSADPNQLATYVANPSLVYQLMDYRTQNLGSLKQQGLDFSLDVRSETRFGSIQAGFAGNIALHESRAVSQTAAFSDTDLSFQSRIRATTYIGGSVGRLSGRLTMNYSGGYRVIRSTTVSQDKVGAFQVFDLNLQYDLEKLGIGKQLTATLNVDNLFNTAPPIFRGDGSSGITNGGTLGRVVTLGLRSRF